jgi:hypothetical protein
MQVVTRLRNQFEQPDGLSAEVLAPLVEEYSRAVIEVNERLTACVGLLRKGLRSEALQRARMKPDLLEAAATLDFPELPDLIDILRLLECKPPEIVDRDSIGQLNEAFIEEKPLEEMLKLHRRLAIAKAPLPARLRLLRKIADRDPMNSVWGEDIRSWELARLQEIGARWLRISKDPEASEEIQLLAEELSGGQWTDPVPKELRKAVCDEAKLRREAGKIQRIQHLAAGLHAAYSEMDEPRARDLVLEWNELTANDQNLLSPSILESVAPALEWLDEKTKERDLGNLHEQRSDALSRLLQVSGAKAVDLHRAHDAVTTLQMGIDPVLESQYVQRIDEINKASQRRLVLSMAAIVASCLLLMTGGFLWFRQQQHLAAVTSASGSISKLLESGDIDAAVRYVDSLGKENRSLVSDPKIAALVTEVSQKREAEDRRREEFNRLMQEADVPEAKDLQAGRILSAEQAAVNPEEKAAVSRLRKRLTDYERQVSEAQFQTIRSEVARLEAALQDIANAPASDSVDADIEEILRKLKQLPIDYPKGVAQAIKLLDLTNERTISLRDSIKKTMRDRETATSGMAGIRSAKSIDEYESELKRFCDKLPNHSYSSEFSKALQESKQWRLADQWTEWCNDLSKFTDGKLEPKEAAQIGSRFASLQSAVTGLPGQEFHAAIKERFPLPSARTQRLGQLNQSLSKSIFLETLTFVSASKKRAFVDFSMLREIESSRIAATTSSTSYIPIINDPSGTVVDKNYRGKFDIRTQPRQLVRNLLSELSERDGIVADWDNRFVRLMESIRDAEDVDGVIKEVLLADILGCAIDGSGLVRKAFDPLNNHLVQTSEDRLRWYIEADENESVGPRTVELLAKGINELKAAIEQQEADVEVLAKTKMVWCGGLIRDESGQVGSFLVRQNIPDGILLIARPSATGLGPGEFLQVGIVNQGRADLQAKAESLLPGRPLFWIRK